MDVMAKYPGYSVIPGFEGLAIDPSGNLLRLKDEKLLVWHTTKSVPKKKIVGGYKRRRVTLPNGCKVSLSRHRALCLTYKPIDSPNGMVVNHLNGVPGDDRLENLEWATYSSNTQHAYDIGLHSEKVRPVLMLNLKTDQVTHFESIAACYKAIGKNENFMSRRLAEKNSRRRFPDLLRFKYDDGKPWPELEGKYTNSRRTKMVMAMNVFDGDVFILESISAAASIGKVTQGAIREHIKRKAVLPINEFVFRMAADDINWPTYTQHQLELYRATPKGAPRGVLATEVTSGRVSLFTSVEQAAKTFCVGTLVVSRLCVSGKNHFEGKIRLEYVYPDREYP